MVIRNFKNFIFLLTTPLLINCANNEKPNIDTAWETPFQKNYSQICQEIPPLWILPIRQDLRVEAVKLLKNKKYIQLDKPNFTKFSSKQTSPDEPVSQTLFNEAMTSLEGGTNQWGLNYCSLYSGKDCMKELILLKTRPRDAKPFLIRAVLKHEATGRFSAQECEDGVHISHSSLGQFVPPSTKTPVIVFLSREPKNVYTSTNIAG